MPHITEKEKLLKYLEDTAVNELLMLELFGASNGGNHLEEEHEILEELISSTIFVTSFRYVAPFQHYSVPRSNTFLLNVLPALDENRFRKIVRVSWANFQIILNLIKDDDIFHGPRSCKQFPVDMQLMIVMYRLGSSGEGATLTKIASLFGIGDGGTLQNITNRIFKAILKLKDKFLYWPNAEERAQIVSNTYYELPHCVGYVDGTEIKLAEKPSDDPEAYFSRKHIYSVKVQAVCDYKRRIRHMVLGYPGSVHDSRIYKNCSLSMKPAEFLSGDEWIAGDSAYKLTTTVVTPFRANSNEGTLQDRNDFNRTFSKYRIRIEHCFGIMKERFNSLKELKIQLKGDSSMKFLCRWVLVCAILHNIIMERNEDIFEPQVAMQEDPLEQEEPISCHQSVDGELKRRALLEIIREINN